MRNTTNQPVYLYNTIRDLYFLQCKTSKKIFCHCQTCTVWIAGVTQRRTDKERSSDSALPRLSAHWFSVSIHPFDSHRHFLSATVSCFQQKQKSSAQPTVSYRLSAKQQRNKVSHLLVGRVQHLAPNELDMSSRRLKDEYWDIHQADTITTPYKCLYQSLSADTGKIWMLTSCRSCVDCCIDYFKRHHTDKHVRRCKSSKNDFKLGYSFAPISRENITARETWQWAQWRTLGLRQDVETETERLLLHGRGSLWDWRLNLVTAQGGWSCCAFRTSNLHLIRKLILIFLPKQRPALYSHQHLRDSFTTTTLPKCSC